jgi:hypothetical protein
MSSDLYWSSATELYRSHPQTAIALAASASAIAAFISTSLTFFLLFYATRTLRTTKRLEKVRLTLGQLDSPDFKKALANIHDYLKQHSYSLTAARRDADEKWREWYLCEPDCAIEDIFVSTFHPITHLSTLFALKLIDRKTILDRHALLFARYYFVFYTYLETLQVQGDQTGTALALGRASLDAVRARPKKVFAENPELRTCYIPGLVTERIAAATVKAMDELREQRPQRRKVSTEDTSSAAT